MRHPLEAVTMTLG